MSYNYYRSSAPTTWGTSNYRFGSPPEPHFRPEPSWNGLDYYRAHALDPDTNLYHRVREGRHNLEGAGLHDARHWHRQAYGGFGDVRNLHPREIGHAAAYEAYRIWIHNRLMGDLRPDSGQRREAFLALAVAEVSHIYPSSHGHNDRRSFREACETAAATASTIFRTMDEDAYSNSGSYYSPPPPRRSGSASSDEFSDDLYAYDERIMPRSPHRHRRRSSSVSFNSRPAMIPQGSSPYQPASSVPMPIPINQQTYSYSSGGSPYQPGSSPYSNPSPYLAPGSYPQYSNGVQGVPIVAGSYDPNQAVQYQNPASYPQQTYIQAQPGMTQGVPMPPGSTIIIQQPSKSSRHKHHKHRSSSRDERRRHRSHSDVVYTSY